MKSEVVRNHEAYNALGKYEKYFYDRSKYFFYLMPLLPFISFGVFCISFAWHWYIYPLFLLVFFFVSLFLIDKFCSIDITNYICEDCNGKMDSLGTTMDYDMDSVFECPKCKKKVYS